ncbi:hypothetical protein [Halorubrum sp. DTA46]|uniref:hypothetical protein n=1 Tax=Halorubrum sp. DTA46 TaxID=3402162 RepID=UPI003AAB6BBF
MTGYYDYILGLIPAALLGVTALLNLVGLPLTAALSAGAAVAAGLIAHAMFVKGPVADERPAAVEQSVEWSAGRSAERAVRQSRGQSLDETTGRGPPGGAAN